MRYSKVDNATLIAAILICISAVNLSGCFVADTVQRGDTSWDTTEISLPKRTDFQFSGTAFDATREYISPTGQAVYMPESFKKPSIECYIPPANRTVNIDVSNASAEEVASIIAEQAAIGYVSDPKWGIFFVRPPLSKELSLEKILKVIKEVVDDRMKSDDLNDIRFNNYDLVAINEPFYIAEEIASYMKTGDLETRYKALYFICAYRKDVFTLPLRDWEQMRKIDAYLHPLVEKVVWELVEEFQWKVPVEDLTFACGEYSVPMLKKLMEKEEYQFSAALTLTYLGDDSGLKYVKEGLSDNDPSIRFKATEALWLVFGDKQGLEVMIEDLKRAHTANDPVFSSTISVLESMTICPYIGSREEYENMIEEMREAQTRHFISSYSYILGLMGDEKAVPVLIEQIMGPESAYVRSALQRIVKRDMPSEYTDRFLPEEELYKNWKIWWDQYQKDKEKSSNKD